MRLLLLLISLIFISTVHSATYYTATTGSDGNSCDAAQSESTPKLTIDGASGGTSCLSSGDTLIIKAGVYDEKIDGAALPNGTSFSDMTTVIAATGESVIIRPSASSGPAIEFFSAAEYIRFSGIEIDMSLQARDCSTCAAITCSAGASKADFIQIDNTHIKSTPTSAIGILPTCDGWVVTGNIIEDVDGDQSGSTDGAHGLYWRGSDSTITNNKIINHNSTNGSGNCIQFRISSGNPACTINNNKFMYNHCDKYPDYGVYIGALACNILVAFNVFSNALEHGGSGFGGAVRYLGTNQEIYNNTFFDIPSNACRGCPAGQVINNIFHDVPTSDTFGTTNIVDPTDPLFFDEVNGLFSLKTGSPAIGAAVDVGLPKNGTPDIGAFQISEPSNPIEVGIINATTISIKFQTNTDANGVTRFGPFSAPNSCTGFSFLNISCSPSCTSVTSSGDDTLLVGLSCPVVQSDSSISVVYNGTHVVDSSNIGGVNQQILGFTELVTNNVQTGGGPTPLFFIESVTLEGITITN